MLFSLQSRFDGESHFAYTVNWHGGLGKGAPQPRGPLAVRSPEDEDQIGFKATTARQDDERRWGLHAFFLAGPTNCCFSIHNDSSGLTLESFESLLQGGYAVLRRFGCDSSLSAPEEGDWLLALENGLLLEEQ